MRIAHRVRAAAAAAIALTCALTGCGSVNNDANAGGHDGVHDAEGGPIRVFAAASLEKAFTEIQTAFKEEHPEVEFELVTGGSQELVTQLKEGADADVVALASEKAAQPLNESGAVNPEQWDIFAENTLVIAVQEGNPKRITDITDLANRDDIRVAACAPEVPCGSATEKLLDIEGVSLKGETRENNVSATLAKAEIGEVDAAIVYASDVATSEAPIEAIVPKHADEVVNRYPIVAYNGSYQGVLFSEFVRGEQGRKILVEYGLTIPEDAPLPTRTAP